MSDETSQQEQLMDLANKSSRSTVAVIDAMTQRGAFKGEELSTIGGLRDQCIQVIQLVENLEQEAAMESEQHNGWSHNRPARGHGQPRNFLFTFAAICGIMFFYMMEQVNV